MTTDRLINIPTNIITGFLGTGKTSAILNLLKNKPDNERWAVLVNEFGEIGVDGSLFAGLHKEEQSVFIHEVPGGCMCCTAGVPMRTALNKLLKHSRPHRLLIEPTGLGHPAEVVKSLTASHFSESLSLHKIITLVDARNLSDPRYTSHETFNQQLEIADIIIGNKQDLYESDDNEALISYVREQRGPKIQVLFSQYGIIDPALLNGSSSANNHSNHSHSHHHHSKKPDIEQEIPECGYIKAINSGEGYQSMGWRFTPNTVFSHEKLLSFFDTLKTERMKAVFNTNHGVYGYNLSSGQLTETNLLNSLESRIEIIAPKLNDHWESELLDCRL